MTTPPTMVERCARAIARVMNGSIMPGIGTDDDVPVTPEDIYAALAVLNTLSNPDEGMLSVTDYIEGRDEYPKVIFQDMINHAISEGEAGK